jgi:hypothetical protein
MPFVAKREPKTLLEINVLLSLGSLLTPEHRASGKRLPLMEQGRLMVKAMPKATRVGEFVAMWAIAKNELGDVSVESVAEYWNEPVRTAYRRLSEFREVWGPAGFETPDRLADPLIADYRARKERLTARHVSKLLSAEVPISVAMPAGVVG